MWKKIHSNRDPRDTLYSELRREFRPWLERIITALRRLVSVHPKLTFYLMLSLLLFSAVLSFTVFRSREPVKTTAGGRPAVISDGFSKIMETADRLKETIRLKRVVDSLTARERLSAADSLALDSVLIRLQQIQQLKK